MWWSKHICMKENYKERNQKQREREKERRGKKRRKKSQCRNQTHDLLLCSPHHYNQAVASGSGGSRLSKKRDLNLVDFQPCLLLI